MRLLHGRNASINIVRVQRSSKLELDGAGNIAPEKIRGPLLLPGSSEFSGGTVLLPGVTAFSSPEREFVRLSGQLCPDTLNPNDQRTRAHKVCVGHDLFRSPDDAGAPYKISGTAKPGFSRVTPGPDDLSR